MTSAQSLRQLNLEVRRRGNPDWWIDTRRVHPDRQIKVPMVRSPAAEATAKAYFATVAQDTELLCRRANILLCWAQYRALRATAFGLG